MIVIDKKDLKLNEIKQSVFVYPTDTIYGLGCDATNFNLVKRVREIKNRDQKPFSIIAPGKDWILDNCIISKEEINWINKLPGAYTLILKIKNMECVAENVSFSKTLGVRIPNNWFSSIVEKLGFPVVATSANISGKKAMNSLEELDYLIGEKVNFIINDGKLTGKPSVIVDLSSGNPRIIKR